jgi:hypothetical protein
MIDWNGGKSKDLWCWIAVIYYESAHCMTPEVTKIPYDISAATQKF